MPRLVNCIFPGRPHGPRHNVVCLFFVEVDEAPYAAVKWRRGRDQAPLVWRPEGAPSTSRFQVATRWVSTNGVNSPVRNLATMQSYARWLRVQMNDPNPDARPRRVKPEELMELLMQLPEAVFGSSLHRESLVENGYRAVVDARWSGPPPAPLALEAGQEAPGATPTLAIEPAAAVASGGETEDDGEESLPDLTPVGAVWTGSHDLVVIGADDAPAACLLAMPLFVRLVVRAASRGPRFTPPSGISPCHRGRRRNAS